MVAAGRRRERVCGARSAVLCGERVSRERREVVLYVELHTATSFLGRPMQVYCDMGKNDYRPEYLSGLHCELKDTPRTDSACKSLLIPILGSSREA